MHPAQSNLAMRKAHELSSTYVQFILSPSICSRGGKASTPIGDARREQNGFGWKQPMANHVLLFPPALRGPPQRKPAPLSPRRNPSLPPVRLSVCPPCTRRRCAREILSGPHPDRPGSRRRPRSLIGRRSLARYSPPQMLSLLARRLGAGC